MDAQLSAALDAVEAKKAGILPPYLTHAELDDLLAAWHRLYEAPDIEVSNCRFIVDHRMYEEPVFARLATHPVVQEVVRRVIGDFQLAGYAVVATPRNGEVPTSAETVRFHIDHCVYSEVAVPEARDTFVCIWVNFEELGMENGPFALAVGSHADNIGWEHFRKPGDPFVSPKAADWGWQPAFNVGPPGTTAVYSGKTWHAGTSNCSDIVRKGLNMNFVPRYPLDSLKRNPFDICALSQQRYDNLAQLIGEPDYLIQREPNMVYTSPTMEALA